MECRDREAFQHKRVSGSGLKRPRRSPSGAGTCGAALKLHILGIAGTFMGGVAALARELGHAVEGSDQNIYPPMSTQLETARHRAVAGLFDPDHIAADTDEIVVGNALSRGNAAVEHVLDTRAELHLRRAMAARTTCCPVAHAGGRRHPRQDHDDLDPRLPAGSRRSFIRFTRGGPTRLG